MAARIKQCNCKGTPATEFQDSTYGKGKRVHNGGKRGKLKCTCCGKDNG